MTTNTWIERDQAPKGEEPFPDDGRSAVTAFINSISTSAVMSSPVSVLTVNYSHSPAARHITLYWSMQTELEARVLRQNSPSEHGFNAGTATIKSLPLLASGSPE